MKVICSQRPLPPRAKLPEKGMPKNCTEPREQGWRRGSPQPEEFCITFIHPTSRAGKPAGPQAQGKFRINNPALSEGPRGVPPRPQQGWKWGVKQAQMSQTKEAAGSGFGIQACPHPSTHPTPKAWELAGLPRW